MNFLVSNASLFNFGVGSRGIDTYTGYKSTIFKKRAFINHFYLEWSYGLSVSEEIKLGFVFVFFD